MKIKYVSHGLFKTGGYRHEMVFYHALIDFLKLKIDSHKVCRIEKEFKSIGGYLYLLIWAFLKSNSDINIVVARGALPALIRNWFNQKEIYIVLHNHDENDQKSWLYGKYFNVLFRVLKKVKHNRFKVIAVSPFWVQYFKNEKGLKNVVLFPNLFDTAYYETFKVIQKNKWIHLGQYSSKNDTQIYMLAKHLTQIGYYCYFSTLDNQLAKPHNGQFEIIYFMNYEDYLNQMAMSSCTLALTIINEGWNRVAHESMLLGTPVIGYKKGGLGDLLRESQSIDVKNTDEAFTCILNSLWVLPNDEFIQKYDYKQAPIYLEKICNNH